MGRPSGPPGPSTFARLRRLLFFPDNQVAWLPFAVVQGVRASRSGRFDVVYSTSSPVTATSSPG